MFSDYDTPTPASVYLIINPDQKVEYLRLFDCGWLFSFIEQEVSAYRLCKDRDIPDNWLMEYRFKDQSLIPPFSNTDNGDYLSRLLPVTNSLGIWPSNVVRLRDAVFCHKMHIEPLSEQGSHDVLLNHPHFTSSSNYYDDKLVKEGITSFPAGKLSKANAAYCYSVKPRTGNSHSGNIGNTSPITFSTRSFTSNSQ